MRSNNARAIRTGVALSRPACNAIGGSKRFEVLETHGKASRSDNLADNGDRKCDRREPCNMCKMRNVSSECIYEQSSL